MPADQNDLSALRATALAEATRTHPLHWLALAAALAAGCALSAIFPWGFA